MPAEGVILTESVMIHMLADADQALTELEMDMARPPGEKPLSTLGEHVERLRRAIEGTDYVRKP